MSRVWDWRADRPGRRPRPTATADARRRAMQMHAVPAARPRRAASRRVRSPLALARPANGGPEPQSTQKCLRASLSPIVSSAYQHPNAQLMSINLRPSVARGPCTSSRAPTALHRRREDDAHARHDVRTRKLGASRRCHSDHVRAEYDARAHIRPCPGTERKVARGRRRARRGAAPPSLDA